MSKPRLRDKNDRKTETLGTGYLPHINNSTDGIGRILKRFNIQTVFIPTGKVFVTTGPGKKDPLSTPRVYSNKTFDQNQKEGTRKKCVVEIYKNPKTTALCASGHAIGARRNGSAERSEEAYLR
ncbi:hypothetical protein Trydic_g9673 [Trypoxylus dichotomus]